MAEAAQPFVESRDPALSPTQLWRKQTGTPGRELKKGRPSKKNQKGVVLS